MPKTSIEAEAVSALPLDARVGFLLRLAYQKASGNLARQLAGEGVSVARFTALACLAERGALSQNRLGRIAGMEPANIHEMVRAMSREGLVKTRKDPADARRRLVELTRRGRALALKLMARGKVSNDQTLDVLSPAEQARLFRLLRKLVGPLEA